MENESSYSERVSIWENLYNGVVLILQSSIPNAICHSSKGIDWTLLSFKIVSFPFPEKFFFAYEKFHILRQK